MLLRITTENSPSRGGSCSRGLRRWKSRKILPVPGALLAVVDTITSDVSKQL
jgi:hypothetical protein